MIKKKWGQKDESYAFKLKFMCSSNDLSMAEANNLGYSSDGALPAISERLNYFQIQSFEFIKHN